MSTAHLVSVEQYLESTYRPDVDYVDGRIEERNLGEFDHADVQLEIALLLRTRQAEWGIRVLTEVRVQVAPTRFRIPDVCVLRGDGKRERIVVTAPLLCVEVLSPRDTLKGMRGRAQDYFEMGVPVVWILDPETRSAFACGVDGTLLEQRDGVLRVAGSRIEVGVGEIFATLDT